MTPTGQGAGEPSSRRSPSSTVRTAALAGAALLAAGLGTVLFTGGHAGLRYGTVDASPRAERESAPPDAGGRPYPDSLRDDTPAPVVPAPRPSPTSGSPRERGAPAAPDRAGEAGRTDPAVTPKAGTGTAGPPEVGRPASAQPPSRPSRPADELERRVFELTNAARARYGCRPLRLDRRLRATARDHSRDMADRGSLAHRSSDGEKPWERSWEHGYFYYWSENLAHGERTAQQVLDVWMSDARSRADILDCGVEALGVGVAVRQGAPWWTQMFGFR
ncbi:MAG: CAP domain-containing protein [Streptomycetales bacterium]